jgi:hypothetical protein
MHAHTQHLKILKFKSKISRPKFKFLFPTLFLRSTDIYTYLPTSNSSSRRTTRARSARARCQLRLHRREQQHFLDIYNATKKTSGSVSIVHNDMKKMKNEKRTCGIGEEHDETVDPDAPASCWRESMFHSVLELELVRARGEGGRMEQRGKNIRINISLINPLRLIVSLFLLLRLSHQHHKKKTSNTKSNAKRKNKPAPRTSPAAQTDHSTLYTHCRTPSRT